MVCLSDQYHTFRDLLWIDGNLVLRRRRPMTFPYPNAYSHPLPRFAYDSSSGNIHVKFSCDPAYPPPPAPIPLDDARAGSSGAPVMPTISTAWRERQYLISSVPLQKPPSVLDNAAQFFTSAAASFLPPSSPTYHNDELNTFSLRDDEVMEEERGAEGDVDDSPEVRRDIKVLSLPLVSFRRWDTWWWDKGR